MRRSVLPTKATFQTIPYEKISTTGEQDRTWSCSISRESCNLHIKCTAANFLIALMWRWYLNSVFQPYSYYIEADERCRWDKYQHKPSDIHVWSENEKGGWYKRKRRPQKWRREKRGEHSVIKFVTKLKNNI